MLIQKGRPPIDMMPYQKATIARLGLVRYEFEMEDRPDVKPGRHHVLVVRDSEARILNLDWPHLLPGDRFHITLEAQWTT